MSKTEYDLCVIGGGAGGLVVAAGGAALGAKVALVEKNQLGGDCLHYGCVPSKTLLHSASVAQIMRDADKVGIASQSPKISIADVMGRVSEVVKTIEVHDSPERFRSLGVEVIFGAGKFTSRDTFMVNGRAITARHFVIATGSRPAVPPIPGLENVPYLTNETIFSLNEPVNGLIILGAGPIGMEMAQAFTRLDAQVTVVEMGARALPREDTDLSLVVTQRLEREGVRFLFNTRSTRASANGDSGKIHLTVNSDQDGEQVITASHLLVATGRRANVEDLGLDDAGIEVNEFGRIEADRRLRTTNKKVFVCGDVVGPYQFTHMAEHQAGVVLRNALFKLPAKVEDRIIPWCTFTEPELARVGLSEEEATQQNIKYEVFTFPFHDIDRAQAEGETEGLAKIITDKKGHLLGAALVGPHTGELIHEYTLAITKKMKAADLSAVIHIYPSLAQINRRVADQRLKTGLTPSAKKWIKRIFGLRGEDKDSTTRTELKKA